MPFSIEGKRILVTGGARGVGGESTRYFARQGALVVACDIRDEEGTKLAEEATDLGPGKVIFRHTDVTNLDEIKATVDFAVAELGGLDAVVNSAGLPIMSHAEVTPEEEWDRQFSINTKGTALMCETVFPHLKERGGSIVNIAAGGALKDAPILSSSYSASKGAVLSFTRTIGLEWAKYGIRCNAVNPVVATTLGDEIRAKMSPEDAKIYGGMIEGRMSSGRKGDIETDLAPVLEFLISDGSKFINSQIIAVDGGLNPSR
ncbi:3-oxoacyl-ACP reductase [Rhodococcus pyridinivorans KG-16]|uniref:3-oxoacyl-ACP reductase n=1 Tax=Rhodococcus pyridinivorans KG-16 TaxID=1441730 RepID=A0A0V9UE21_9NOCA|nr:SDR family oxidoreductase [Rhodococcus pyridinivorans]KSZ56028.1 3-oxoacyl-ACP reductase [Rhodococcus pyridinivorans KG-16]